MNNMRNLFELSEEQKNEIRMLHESYTKRPGTRLIWEQTEDVTLNQLNEKIKTVLLKNKNKFYQDVTVTISPNGDNGVIESFSLNFKSQTNPTNEKTIEVPTSGTEGLFVKNNVNFNITFDTLKLSDVYEQIFNGETNLKQLYDSDVNVKKQMDSAFVPLYIYTKNSSIYITGNQNRRKNRKGKSFVYGDKVTLDKFYNAAGTDFAISEDTIYSVSFGGLVSDLGEVIINKTGPDPNDTDTPVVGYFDFVLENSFIFDSIDLTPESIENYTAKKDELKIFLNTIAKNQGFDIRNTSIKSIINTDVKIEGYASIDGDSNQNILKAEKLYEPCRPSGTTRSNYNLCLSQKRAEYIANDLNNFVGEIMLPVGQTIAAMFPSVKNWAVGVGKGETTQFSNGKKWPKDNIDDTAPDRRIVFTPKLEYKIYE